MREWMDERGGKGEDRDERWREMRKDRVGETEREGGRREGWRDG